MSADAAIFDGDISGSFSRDHPDRQHGVVTKVIDKRKLLLVRWVGDGLIMKVRAMDVRIEKRKMSTSNILTVLILEGKEVAYESTDKSEWPADFFHALVKSDWRQWVASVKKEIASWDNFNAYTVISIEDKKAGASIRATPSVSSIHGKETSHTSSVSTY